MPLCALPLLTQAQQTEYSVHLNSGVAAFRGASAEPTSFVNLSDTSPGNTYTNNPYGSRWGWSYGAAVQGQHVGKRGLLLGAQLSYDNLRPATRLNGAYAFGTQNYAVEGRTNLENQFIGLYPYIGQRLRLGQVALDITVGAEIARQLSCWEKGRFTLNGQAQKIEVERSHEPWDKRLRAGITLSRGSVSLTAGYSYGLTNYKTGWVGGVNEAYIQAIRLGVAYKVH